jgi:hypothetical protein
VQARYEIFVTLDGRERMEACVADKNQALAAAQQFLAQPTASHARVVELKSGWTGREYEKEIFSAKATAKAEAPVNVPGSVDEPPMCRGVDDLYALPARLAAGQVLRRYLDKHGLTVTELLHNARELKRLNEADMLLVGSIARVATAQVALYGGEVAARTAELGGWVEAATQRARERDLPRAPGLDKNGLADLMGRLPGRPGEPDHDYMGRLGIARELVTIRSLSTKLEVLLDWLAGEAPDDAVRLLDGFLADALASGKVVQESLGARANLAGALMALLDLVHGRLDTTARGTEPLAVKLNDALGRHRLHEARAVLIDRVRRALGGTQRLSQEAEGQAGEDAAFKAIVTRLTTPDGPLGGAGMAMAMVTRYGRLRGKPPAVAVPYAIQGIGGCFVGAWDEIMFLTTLLASPLAARHQATVLAALDGCLEQGGSLDRVMWTIRDPADRLRRVQAFHRLIAGLALPKADKTRIAAWVEKGLVDMASRSETAAAS